LEVYFFSSDLNFLHHFNCLNFIRIRFNQVEYFFFNINNPEGSSLLSGMFENCSIDLLLIIYIYKLNIFDLIDLTHNKKNELSSEKLKIINKKGGKLFIKKL